MLICVKYIAKLGRFRSLKAKYICTLKALYVLVQLHMILYIILGIKCFFTNDFHK